MRNLKFVLEYDGSRYFGFQRQKKQATIQAAFEEAASRFFNRKIKITAASGRTDTGAHAVHQVVNLKIKTFRTSDQILKGMNHFLPRDIAVRQVTEEVAGFHARYDVKDKTYEYRIWNQEVRSPLLPPDVYHFNRVLDLKAMRRAVCALTGRHDFKAFCGAQGLERGERGKRGTVRTLKKAVILKSGPFIRIRFQADGFLNHMVRNMVGTLLEVGTGKRRAGDIGKILLSGDRRHAGAAVPAKGLVLTEVRY
ncbi:MAG: tRNA pseudouridine(38-40) synthase TruA [Omnitrophica bacterium GWA2_52_8]|nr:MAG: tRNA pseudouridine(38-40) synthase TruA [Omnitrophica bacterium GWA2_52_8]